MSTMKRSSMGSPNQNAGDLKPNNSLQSDFNAEIGDDSSMDSDERYLVSSARAASIKWSR